MGLVQQVTGYGAENVRMVAGERFFRLPGYWMSSTHYGPSLAYLLRRKAEEINAAGVACEVIRQDWGHRDYALVIPIGAIE